MASFIVKIWGDEAAPRQVSRPKEGDWDAGELKTDAKPTRRLRKGVAEAENTDIRISPGDLLYVWCNEGLDGRRGDGLTALATASSVRFERGSTYVTLQDVKLLNPRLGFRRNGSSLGDVPLLRAVKSYRHNRTWLMDAEQHGTLLGICRRFGSLPREPEPVSPDPGPLCAAIDPVDWVRALAAEAAAIETALSARRRRLVKDRPSQAAFREMTLRRHAGRCVFTGCGVEEALEAAHVIPHTGAALFERPDNGLLLRCDIHNLFDAFLLAIEPASGRVRVAERLRGTEYHDMLTGRHVEHQVAREPLAWHFSRFLEGEAARAVPAR